MALEDVTMYKLILITEFISVFREILGKEMIHRILGLLYY